MSVQKIYRIEHEGAGRYAVEHDGEYRLIDGDLFAGPPYKTGGAAVVAKKILAPVMPSKVVAIGLNYKDHAAERNKPLPPSTSSASPASTT